MVQPLDLDLLVASAPLARVWAENGCWRDPENGQSCANYHAIWQYLRIIGAVTTLDRHAPYYHKAIAQIAQDKGSTRVLLSGSADYGLLAVVAKAFREAGSEPCITLVDRCGTPLKLARWYAEQRQLAVQTEQADLLDYSPRAGFDLICVHSLFGLIPGQLRPALLKRWHGLLRPGGRILCINAVSPAHHPPVVRFTAEQRRQHRDRVEAAARRCQQTLDLSSEALGEMAAAYSASRSSNVIRSREEIIDLFEQAGLEIEVRRFGPLGIDETHHFSGPTPPEKREYAWIVARRP